MIVNGHQYGDTNEYLLNVVSMFTGSTVTAVCNTPSNISSVTILSIVLCAPFVPNFFDNLIAALFIKSGVHSINVALDNIPLVTLSCMSYTV